MLGCGVLGQLLSADRGYRGPRADCGNGHEAEFVSYRDKVIDTVLGPVTLERAWYHCADCGPGVAPRDAELGVAGTSMSPGLTAMNDTAAAAGPFAEAARLPSRTARPPRPGRSSPSAPGTWTCPPRRARHRAGRSRARRPRSDTRRG